MYISKININIIHYMCGRGNLCIFGTYCNSAGIATKKKFAISICRTHAHICNWLGI